MADQPVLESRRSRLVAFLRHNRDQLITDAAVVLAWIVVSASVFRWLGVPKWLHYLVLFAGIVVYSSVSPHWERPYRSPERGG